MELSDEREIMPLRSAFRADITPPNRPMVVGQLVCVNECSFHISPFSSRSSKVAAAADAPGPWPDNDRALSRRCVNSHQTMRGRRLSRQVPDVPHAG